MDKVDISTTAVASAGDPLAQLAYGVISLVGGDAVGRALTPGMDDVSMAMLNSVLQKYYADDFVLGIDSCVDGSGDFLLLTYLHGVLRCSLVPGAGTIDFKAKSVDSAEDIGSTYHASIARTVSPQMVMARFAWDNDIDPNDLTLTGHFEISLTECVRRKLYLKGTGVFSKGVEKFPVKFEIHGMDLTAVDDGALASVEVNIVTMPSEAQEILRRHEGNETPSFGIKEGLA